jgi:REP element-mobilizing transposase RayT
MSAVIAIYHIVINTHRREMTLPLDASDLLYRYIAAVVKNSQSTLFAINGIENHIHLLINLHPSVRLSDLVRDIKLSTSQWIKQNRSSFPQFAGWGKEYGAFSYAMRDKEMVANYIRNQRVHHQRELFEEEYRKHLHNAGIEWNDYRLT